MGWVCKECSLYLVSSREEYWTLRDHLEGKLTHGESDGLDKMLRHPYLVWISHLDCDDGDDVRRMIGMSRRLTQAKEFFDKGLLPVWERPVGQERQYSKQVAQTALRAGEEVFNLASWGRIKLGYRAIKMAAKGYKLSEQLTHYILSEEFMQAWKVFLQQLGDFAEHSAIVKQQTLQTETTARRAYQTIDICKRFYYFSMRLLMHRLSNPETQEEGTPCSSEQIDHASEYLSLIALVYKSCKGGRPSQDPVAESAWFLSNIIDKDMAMLEVWSCVRACWRACALARACVRMHL